MQRPDGNLADDFLIAAGRLIPTGRGKPRQGMLRRSVSSSYYAVFHALAKIVADALIGSRPSSRPNRAWVEVYRGLEHGSVKQACERAHKIAFPQEIKDFADAFTQLHDARHRADYDPQERFTKENAETYLALAQTSMSKLRAVRSPDALAFAAWVLITSKGATDARKKPRP